MVLSKSVMSFIYHIKIIFLSVHLSRVFIINGLICLTFIYCYKYNVLGSVGTKIVLKQSIACKGFIGQQYDF